MAPSTATRTPAASNPYRSLGLATGAGILAGLAFGLLIQFVLGRMPAIGAMYTLGDPSLTVGWIAHVVHSAVFGALYGLLAVGDTLRDHANGMFAGPLLGAGYATVLWGVNIGFLWPIWLNSVGFGAGLPVPFLAVLPLVGHLVYGVGLGGLYALASRR